MNADTNHEPKIGAGHASAMWRTGLAELRNAVYPDSNVAVRHAETGLYGTATQYEINSERQGDTPSKEDAGSIVDQRLRQAEASRDDGHREAPQIEKE